MPRDAESWLADRGITREVVFDPSAADEPPEEDDDEPDGAAAATSASTPDAAVPGAGGPSPAGLGPAVDEGELRRALAFVRRSASAAPQAEGRLREKLLERDVAPDVIEAALAAARSERLVDDRAMLAALVAERRARGHATARLRRDLLVRGFTATDVEAALGAAAPTDPEADAFAQARTAAARHRDVAPETALRRTVDHLRRLGHPDGLARKVAREAVFADREPERTASR